VVPHLSQDRYSIAERGIRREQVRDIIYGHSIQKSEAMRDFRSDRRQKSRGVWPCVQVLVAYDLGCQYAAIQINLDGSDISIGPVSVGWTTIQVVC
jgi:hypothetical protein